MNLTDQEKDIVVQILKDEMNGENYLNLAARSTIENIIEKLKIEQPVVTEF